MTAPSKRCSKCGETKPLDEFYRDRSSRDGLNRQCKTCINVVKRRWLERNPEYARQHYADNRDRLTERHREYYAENREAVLAVNHAYADAHREEIKAQKREHYWFDPEAARLHSREWREANLELEARLQHDRHQARRAQVFGHYGTSCACCGSTEELQIDHIEGGGKAHRIELFGHRGSTQMFYNWLIREGFPEGFQTLCKSCNSSKHEGDWCRLHIVPAGYVARRYDLASATAAGYPRSRGATRTISGGPVPVTTQSAYAADNQPSAPRQFPAGKEPAKNTDLAKHGGDLANQTDRAK